MDGIVAVHVSLCYNCGDMSEKQQHTRETGCPEKFLGWPGKITSHFKTQNCLKVRQIFLFL